MAKKSKGVKMDLAEFNGPQAGDLPSAPSGEGGDRGYGGGGDGGDRGYGGGRGGYGDRDGGERRPYGGDRDRGDREDRRRYDEDGNEIEREPPPPSRADEADVWRRRDPPPPADRGFGGDRPRYGDRDGGRGYGDRDGGRFGGDRGGYGDRDGGRFGGDRGGYGDRDRGFGGRDGGDSRPAHLKNLVKRGPSSDNLAADRAAGGGDEAPAPAPASDRFRKPPPEEGEEREERRGGDREGGDRPRFGGDRDGGDRPRFGGDRDGGDRPRFGGDRDGGDRPRFGGDRDGGDRPRFGGDRDGGDRPRFGGDRFGDRDGGRDGGRFGDRDGGRFGGDRDGGRFGDRDGGRGGGDRWGGGGGGGYGGDRDGGRGYGGRDGGFGGSGGRYGGYGGASRGAGRDDPLPTGPASRQYEEEPRPRLNLKPKKDLAAKPISMEERKVEVDEAVAGKGVVHIAAKQTPLDLAVEENTTITDTQLAESMSRLKLDKGVDAYGNVLAKSLIDGTVSLPALVSASRTKAAPTLLLASLSQLRAKKSDKYLLDLVSSAQAKQPELDLLTAMAGARKDQELDAFLEANGLLVLKPVPDLSAAVAEQLQGGARPEAVLKQVNDQVDAKLAPGAKVAVIVAQHAFAQAFKEAGKVDLAGLKEWYPLLQRVAPGSDADAQLRVLFEAQVAWFKAGAAKGAFKELFQALYNDKVIRPQAMNAWSNDTTEKSADVKKSKTKALFQVSAWITEIQPKVREADLPESDADEELMEEYGGGDDE